MSSTRAFGRRSGLTLVEMSIACAVLGLVVGAATMVLSSAQGAVDDSMLRERAAGKLQRALARVAQDLTATSLGTLQPDPFTPSGLSSLTFAHIIGSGTAAPAFDVFPRQLQRVAAPTDADDGADNDGDGAIDEGQLVLTLDVGAVTERDVVLCDDVSEYYLGEVFNGADDNGNGLIDEAGFHVVRAGTLLTIRLCVAEPGAGGTSSTAAVETAINVRN